MGADCDHGVLHPLAHACGKDGKAELRSRQGSGKIHASGHVLPRRADWAGLRGGAGAFWLFKRIERALRGKVPDGVWHKHENGAQPLYEDERLGHDYRLGRDPGRRSSSCAAWFRPDQHRLVHGACDRHHWTGAKHRF
ncbi:hypothetical protein D3C78_1077870 [compost metagenome]